MFSFADVKELIVFGRRGLAAEVDMKMTGSTPGGGSVMSAEVGFRAAAQGQVSIRLAAFGPSTSIGGGGEWEERMRPVAEVLAQRSVRLMAGECGDDRAHLDGGGTQAYGGQRMRDAAAVYDDDGGPRGPHQGFGDPR